MLLWHLLHFKAHQRDPYSSFSCCNPPRCNPCSTCDKSHCSLCTSLLASRFPSSEGPRRLDKGSCVCVCVYVCVYVCVCVCGLPVRTKNEKTVFQISNIHLFKRSSSHLVFDNSKVLALSKGVNVQRHHTSTLTTLM